MTTEAQGPRLSIATPGKLEQTVALTGPYHIGRGTANDLVLADGKVSRGHALLRPFGRGRYYLLDMGSSNGTFLNGKLVGAPAELKAGDVITIGDTTLRFLSDHDQKANATAELETQETVVKVSTEAVSLLIVDIRDFTGLTEKVPQRELPTFIGAWFKDASATIESHGGVIDKFIGDAIMAYWLGEKAPGPALARGPLDAALELVEAAKLYHGNLSARHAGLEFKIGCGVHLGEAAFGNIGRSARRDFTAIGDCVNVAFRLESLCKELGRTVIVSEDVVKAAGDAYAFEDLGLHSLKGKTAQFRVFGAKAKA